MFRLSFNLVGLYNGEGLGSLCSRSAVCMYCWYVRCSFAWKTL